MREDEIRRLTEKYERGETTLEEEVFLFENVKEPDTPWANWFTFLENNKITPPEDLNDRLWESFEGGRDRKRKKMVWGMAAAASVLLLVSFLILGPRQSNEQDFAQKEALFKEALDMIGSMEPAAIERTIVYENEMVIIYTTKE
ncbi:hypothetical protein [Sediminicola luteus]|uniref:Uncharacterized protein n=1 Tax=Sediminicola luteus TaxID=319238 RepID=A0A2A4GBG4_9FLAO|nr:hypothetical protein [Sediminicola luteus]PCE66299.1 hypothetical protein B7P33_03090 [Sediminicola luteus]